MTTRGFLLFTLILVYVINSTQVSHVIFVTHIQVNLNKSRITNNKYLLGFRNSKELIQHVSHITSTISVYQSKSEGVNEYYFICNTVQCIFCYNYCWNCLRE